MSTQRERRLGEARANLVELPDLVEKLETQLTEHPPADGKHHHKVVGSPALIRLDVFHLTDPRHKDGWELEDPRHARLTNWLGIVPLLEAWTRVLWEEIPELLDLTETATVRSEAALILEYWPYVDAQPWGEELAKDINTITKQVRAALGIREAVKYHCPECGNPAYTVPGGILSCEEGHERIVRNLERDQRRRPPMTTKDICAEFGVTPNLLKQWKFRRRIAPITDDSGRQLWLPWDVFCILNPDIADALNLRDETEAG